MEANGTKRAAMKDGIPRVIKLGEAAQIINCSYSTTLRMARSGELKAFRVRGAWRTTDAICAEYIERRIAEQQLISQSVEVD